MADVGGAVVSTGNQSNLEKVERFFNDALYKESIESSLNYNTRLCLERRMRLPFIDTQTGVAQNHSSLFMHRRQRMPGLVPGQIYCYPRPRWRKRRRQYLVMHTRAFARAADSMMEVDGDMHNISQIENPALQDTDSKDSQLLLKDDVSKEWFYEDPDMLDMDAYDEPDPDSDLDYEESYSKRSKKKKPAGRGRGGTDSPNTPGRKKGSGRGRKKASAHSFEPTPGDPDKPFACELCGARYKTRPGLTYHYSHSHKEGASDENSRDSLAASGQPPTPSSSSSPHVLPNPQAQAQPQYQHSGVPQEEIPSAGGGAGGATSPSHGPHIPGNVYQDSYVSFLSQTPGTPGRRGRQPAPPPGTPNQPPPPLPPQMMPPVQAHPPTLPPNLPPNQPSPPVDDPPMPVLVPEKIDPPPPIMTMMMPTTVPQASSASGGVLPLPPVVPPEMLPAGVAQAQRGVKAAAPSPYCDFCLGDARENRKTGGVEELVSCSDCGRSGHPSCLLFTDNMKISVKKYSWQCIECKCCSVCGTSDNDDQLLFCDDCDRGYHMYCLTPPLTDPPEGSWSCKLCIEQFHK